MIRSRLPKILFAAAATNVIVLAAVGHYDLRLGPVHLASTWIFKPLLCLNAAFLLALALNPARKPVEFHEPGGLGMWFYAAAAGVVAALYGISFAVNLEFPDWTHRHITSSLGFVTARQSDGFYRPLTFLSLWLDNRIFGGALWGFHIQNVLIHFANGCLVARLASRFGLGVQAARWSGLLFLSLPIGFEAVVWPGARFDLLALMFFLFALDRALAGSLALSTAAYILAVLSKESAYAYPLILVAAFLLRRQLALPFEAGRARRVILAAALATVAMVAVRIAVYGDLGGYPDVNTGRKVQFSITEKTFTSMAARFPAALYLVNSSAGVPVWLGAAVVAYVGVLALALAGGAGLGGRAALLLLALLGSAPTVNIIGWMNQSAQQARYVYLPAVFIVLAVSWSLLGASRGPLLLAALLVTMAAGTLFNTLAYVRMARAADAAAAAAIAACRSAGCCRTLNLRDLPADLYGAFYFRYQVRHEVEKALPEVRLSPADSPDSPGACTLDLRWTGVQLNRDARSTLN